MLMFVCVCGSDMVLDVRGGAQSGCVVESSRVFAAVLLTDDDCP